MKKALIILALLGLVTLSTAAQKQQLTSKMLYHNGPILTGTQNIYALYYGCWTDTCGSAGDLKTRMVLTDFFTSIGNSRYAQINSTYTDASGQQAASAFIFGGEVIDASYSHGTELTRADIVDLISYQVNNFQLPQDSNGIYVIIASADVASSDTGFCAPSAPPFHGRGLVNGSPVNYIFLGNPQRCPAVAGPQFSPSGPTPNDSYAADVLASNFAHALNGIATNPLGTGWYDRYGFENTDKCQDALGHPAFGQTYLTANGARANVRMASRDYLIEQNWVNDRKGRCAMFP